MISAARSVSDVQRPWRRLASASKGFGSAVLVGRLGVDGDGGVGECCSEVVGDDVVGGAGGAVGAGVGADGEVAGDQDGVALGEAVEG